MLEVVKVDFKDMNGTHLYDPQGLDLSIGDLCVVETDEGLDTGEIVMETMMVEESKIKVPLKKVVRKLSQEDIDQIVENEKREKEAYRLAIERISRHELPLKLVGVRFIFEGTTATFLYISNNKKIDLKPVIKELSAILGVRIKMQQIGVRDHARMLGGIGCCGLHLCCTTFLKEFLPVSVRMAKEQNLSLNPSKISGVCGRLMCCLGYECKTYREARNSFPSVGGTVRIKQGEGTVVRLNIIKETVYVQVEKEREVEVPLSEIRW